MAVGQWPAIVSDAPRLLPADGAPSFEGSELAAVVGGRIIAMGTLPIRGGAVDSRRVTPGVCFFALPGERTDGQRFLPQAVAAGASALIVRDVPAADDLQGLTRAHSVTVIQVPDGQAALHAAARVWRARWTPLVVGVTGSLAKTSTKEQVAEVLAERWPVLRNEGNENNEIGLPLTLLRLAPEHGAAVLEMGMYMPRDIAQLADLARPSIGVVTAVRGTHLSRAGSIDAIERGKAELVEALPADGTAVLNADDERVGRFRAHTRATVVTYGFGASADVTAWDVVSLAEDGMRFRLVTPEGSIEVATPALGRHSVHNALAAAGVALAAGLDLGTIARGLARGFKSPHRTSFLRAGGWRILDDSYNAAPDSMIAALELLGSLGGRRVAVLGEMLELGDAADESHLLVGRLAARHADRLIVVGPGAAGIVLGARAAGMGAARATSVPDRMAALALLVAELRDGDAVLVKASRGVALDVLVDALVAAASEGTPA